MVLMSEQNPGLECVIIGGCGDVRERQNLTQVTYQQTHIIKI